MPLLLHSDLGFALFLTLVFLKLRVIGECWKGGSLEGVIMGEVRTQGILGVSRGQGK